MHLTFVVLRSCYFPFLKNSEGRKPREGRCPAKELASITSCLGSFKSKESWVCQQLQAGKCSCQELSTSDPIWARASCPEHADGGTAAGDSAISPARQALQAAFQQKYLKFSTYAKKLARKLFTVIFIRQSPKAELASIIVWKTSETVSQITFPDFLGSFSRY